MADESKEAVNQTITVGETGEGSLLAATVSMVEERNRSDINHIDDLVGALEPGRVERRPDGGLSVLAPQDFDAYRSKPLYRRGTVELGSLDSLIDYTNRFKDGDSAVFANDDRNAPAVVTVLDYNKAGGPEDGGQRFGRHRARHALPLSDQWQAWHEMNGEDISMQNFARFLEDHIVDVLPTGMITLSDEQQRFVDALGGPSMIATPSKLMEIATGLRIYEDSQLSQAHNLATGEAELIFTSSHTDGAGGKLVVPSMFVIAIPVFRHGAPYQIVTRLRYRKAGGITFKYELWRDDLVFDHAFDEAVNDVANRTSLATFRGKPE